MTKNKKGAENICLRPYNYIKPSSFFKGSLPLNMWTTWWRAPL
ncbi:hypothetical protein EVA_14496 [gut metagenome]|uniref:Uncharacterized protein n=1 Tax=gut metagenome TaxID=749906 RepID=J9G6H3_9ZZZZ